MKEFLDGIFGMAFICGIIFMVASVIGYFYPPKKLNAWIGYRTAASLISQERWDFAQKFSALVRIKTAPLMILLSLTGYFFPEGKYIRMIGSIFLIITWLRYMTNRTDKELKKRFTK